MGVAEHQPAKLAAMEGIYKTEPADHAYPRLAR